jgi:hypothetical protein
MTSPHLVQNICLPSVLDFGIYPLYWTVSQRQLEKVLWFTIGLYVVLLKTSVPAKIKN